MLCECGAEYTTTGCEAGCVFPWEKRSSTAVDTIMGNQAALDEIARLKDRSVKLEHNAEHRDTEHQHNFDLVQKQIGIIQKMEVKIEERDRKDEWRRDVEETNARLYDENRRIKESYAELKAEHWAGCGPTLETNEELTLECANLRQRMNISDTARSGLSGLLVEQKNKIDELEAELATSKNNEEKFRRVLRRIESLADSSGKLVKELDAENSILNDRVTALADGLSISRSNEKEHESEIAGLKALCGSSVSGDPLDSEVSGNTAAWNRIHQLKENLRAEVKKSEVAQKSRNAQVTIVQKKNVEILKLQREANDYDYVRKLAIAGGERIAELEAEKDSVYAERNRLVAALSKVFPSHLSAHDPDDETWEDDWRTIVCVHLPDGQVTWHIHDSHRDLFIHLSQGVNHWDGHTTEEKYKRLAAYRTTGSSTYVIDLMRKCEQLQRERDNALARL